MSEELKKYFDTLNLKQCIEAYSDAVRHGNYCPCECHCFDEHPEQFSAYSVKMYIVERFKK